jgi:hypothetical protein
MPSVSDFAGRISFISGSPNKLKLFRRSMLIMLGWFIPVVRELKENLYQFEKTILLDDSALRVMYPDFKETGLDGAIRETIRWYRKAA